MFGGYGFDYIFYPEGSNISLGLETFYVKKREYTLDLKFKDYSNYITRASIELSEPRTDINFKLSAGEYLAGDKGYTFEVSRRFENGVKFLAIEPAPPKYFSVFISLSTKIGSFPDFPRASEKVYSSIINSPITKILVY